MLDRAVEVADDRAEPREGRVVAARALTPAAARTGVTTVTMSSMVSNTAITVGRMNRPEGRPIVSGFCRAASP
jgi:hypothetical protein